MSKYLPTYINTSVFSIDYTQLYASGKRIILFDLDNTLISYDEEVASKELIDLLNSLKNIGFKVYILTNNHEKRVKKFSLSFKVDGIGYHMNKPFTNRIAKYLSNNHITLLNEVIMIGDQLVTDILCANRLKVDSILVKSINRSTEKFYTVINRLREPLIIKRLSKINYDYAMEIKKIITKEKRRNNE